MADSRVEDVARFFDREACCGPSSRRAADGRLHAVSRILLEMLDDADVTGRTVLDAGCGQGTLSVALSERGVRAVTGIDLSPESVAVARRAAEQRGLSTRFLVANAASDSIEPHDVVVLNTVVCCYFDADALLANTLPAARSVVALSLPHSRGPRGALARVLLVAENAWRGLRGDPFRAFVHDEVIITRTLDRHGFSVTAQRDYWMWHVATFERQP
jgi:2-polyprenyl-3-methyl-5-hydroxy-6-metoxy-1,4-benzoquinol methylase